MKVHYKNCEIEAYRGNREQKDLIFYSIFTDDGPEITSGYSDSLDTIRDWVDCLKQVVDDFNEKCSISTSTMTIDKS